jgi:hypothetical protein
MIMTETIQNSANAQKNITTEQDKAQTTENTFNKLVQNTNISKLKIEMIKEPVISNIKSLVRDLKQEYSHDPNILNKTKGPIQSYALESADVEKGLPDRFETSSISTGGTGQKPEFVSLDVTEYYVKKFPDKEFEGQVFFIVPSLVGSDNPIEIEENEDGRYSFSSTSQFPGQLFVSEILGEVTTAKDFLIPLTKEEVKDQFDNKPIYPLD